MWSTDTGFLLVNYNFIRYSDISFDQLTRPKWIKLNCVSIDAIKQLMAKFNKDSSVFSTNVPQYKQKQQQNQTITGTPYYHSTFNIIP